MSRKRCNRRPVVPMLPKGLRPKLARDQMLDLAIVHISNLDDMAKGLGTPDLLWQITGGVLTWSRVAEKTGQHVETMREQLDLMRAVTDRWTRTGRVLFTGPEYQAAKRGVQVMDELALIVDRATAVEAANWSEDELQHIVAAAETSQACGQVAA
jgi:hypothetical protein